MQSLKSGGLKPKDIAYEMSFAPKVDQSSNNDLLWRVAERWLYELDLTLDKMRLAVVKFNIDKMEAKYNKEKHKKHGIQQQQALNLMKKNSKGKKAEGVANPNVASKMRHFQPK